MIKPLRKKHLQVWSLWAFLIPLGVIAATLVRKPLVKEAFELGTGTTPLAVVVEQKQAGQNLLQLRGREPGTVAQLVWISREPLRVPTATIYLAKSSNANINEAVYIGRIENRGTYVFGLPVQRDYHFIVYDFIQHQIIGRVSFNLNHTKQPTATTNNFQTPNSSS